MKIGLKFRCYPDSTLQQLIHQRDENATENLINYESYEKVNNKYQYKVNPSNNQAGFNKPSEARLGL